jgi:putative flippase GtrA
MDKSVAVSRGWELFGQLWRSIIVGAISAGVDYSILFLLSSVTHIAKGNGIIPLNMISFTAGTVTAYLLNKNWSFADKLSYGHGRKFSLFVCVSIIGVIINTAIVRVISTEVSPLWGLTPTAWLIASKIMASAFSFSWNFSGYKWIVFKK